jgi:hypothetical protein
MKKIIILMVVVALTVLMSIAMANHKGNQKGDQQGDQKGDQQGDQKAGRLFLFQKCDTTLIGNPNYDSAGCPSGPGPWPVFLDNGMWGKLDYSLWGKEFKFSFEGKRLLPKKNYTLIYYADPWPGNYSICLGSGKTNKAGNIEIHGSQDIGTGLPVSGDANYKAVPNGSGAVGAKIWLVLSDDVKCTNGSSNMLNWNPTAYLFEYNLIVYEHNEMGIDEELEND